MTPAAMAALYARAFRDGRPWSADEIAQLMAAPGFAVTTQAGFALGRAVAGEAELVTVAVDPGARRQGQGRALLAAFDAQARALGAETAFLEVAADNTAAQGLYRATGWVVTGRRKAYYRRATGAVDAVMMTKVLG
ncbi:MAG TPA: 30S ribosomal protein S18 alanine N-acetyltransferase [Rhodobacteraceae bacterium]|nr:30S ribosomal protein S18 alanine N-acetyltransferase [Paracoccaceae bacterium]